MDDPPKRRRVLGTVGVTGYLALIIFIGVQAGLSMRGGPGSVGSFVGPVPLWIVVSVVFGCGMLGFLRLFMILRDSRVRRRSPGAVVHSAVRVIELVKAAESLPNGRIMGAERRFPMQFSFVVHPDGSLDFWRVFPEFRAFLHIESTEISGCRAAATQESGRITRCLMIESSLVGVTVELPIVVVGRGFFGLFPPSAAALERLAARISPVPTSESPHPESA